VVAVCFFLVSGALPARAGSTPGFQAEDFYLLANKGFDSPQNNYAWSGAGFRGDVYIGTARNFLFEIFEVLRGAGMIPADYQYQFITRPGGALWSQQFAEEMGGEIWRYRSGEWTRVYKSGAVDVSLLAIPGAPTPAYAPSETGFRSMVTYVDKWGKQAIYAASGASPLPGRLLLKSTDGTSWEKVATAPTLLESDSRSMAVHNGKLYVAPTGARNTATIWATDDPVTTGNGSNWKKVADFTIQRPGTNVAVVSMVSFRGRLYAGTQNDEAGFQVWRSNTADPKLDDWTRIIDSGAGDMASTRALTMTVFRDSVIVGTSMFPISANPPGVLPPKGFEVIRILPNDSWQLLVGDFVAQKPPGNIPVPRLAKSGWPGGFGNILNLYCWSLKSNNGVLYLGTFDVSSFLSLLFPDGIFFGPTLAGSGTDLQAALGALEKLGLEKYYGPYRQFAGTHPEGEATAADAGTTQALIPNYFFGADLWKSTDAVHWEPVTLNGFGNPTNYGFRIMLRPWENSLLVGTANPFDGLEVLRAIRRR
jgi:hypothetical protein